MGKIGRNAPCPCGSGQKFKRCCGSFANTTPRPPAEAMKALNLLANRHEADEHRRRLMQGLGNPIVSFEQNGFRMVAVGTEIRWSKGWRTFADFLFDYIKIKLTPDWGNAELAKPGLERHPVLNWYRLVCDFQRSVPVGANGIYSAEITGAVQAYLGLAYDLYLGAHNAQLQEILLKRLRHPQTFEGALYECFVIGCFAKAGFSIDFEDESDPDTSHCEFTATHRETGRKFSVEAKSVSSSSSRAGNSEKPPQVRHKINQALKKVAVHERIVFIELNRAEPASQAALPGWTDDIYREIKQAEGDLIVNGQPAPSAYLFVTNRGFVYTLHSPQPSEMCIVYGFKIHDFPPGRGALTPLQAYKARERHIEAHWLAKAMETHRSIPTTFDSRLPEEVFVPSSMPKIRIGDRHFVPDENGLERVGTLEDAVVMERESVAYGTYLLENGTRVLCSIPLTETELAIYKRSPDTFFGVLKPVSNRIKTPLDAFDFVAGSYMQTPREKLLEFVADAPDIEALRQLPQKELAEAVCDRWASSMWNQIGLARDSGDQS